VNDEEINDEGAFFRDQLADIKPLKKTNKASIKKPLPSAEQLALARKRAEVGLHEYDVADGATEKVFVSDDYVDMLKPGDFLNYKRPGVQDGVFKKLRLGKYVIDGRLDLHRKTVKEARAEVFGFVHEAMTYDSRTLLILHGKGERNVERPAVLKSYVAKWLKELPEVLAFHTAQQRHGGLGAVYVLLRKSEKLKEKAREEHAGRRGLK